MVSTSIKRIAALTCVLVIALALAGCAPQSNPESDAQKANRAYMSQVNETMNDLSTALGAFVDAVSRDDLVNMRSQADNAYKLLDKLTAIEAPEALSDIKQNYVDGTDKLKQALDSYITLYSETKSSESVDRAAFAKSVADIQKVYDEGIALLEKGDKAAADKN